MGFSIQEYWSGLPFPKDLPDPGIKPKSLMSPTLADSFCTRATWEAPWCAMEEQISSQYGCTVSSHGVADPLGTGTLQVVDWRLEEEGVAWCEPSDHRQAVHRSL